MAKNTQHLRILGHHLERIADVIHRPRGGVIGDIDFLEGHHNGSGIHTNIKHQELNNRECH